MSTRDSRTAGTSQFLSFRLGDSVFALDIFEVREVLGDRPITKVPGMPSCVCGLIDVRGKGVPVIDLHRKFGSGTTRRTSDTCIIVAEVEVGGVMTERGALADSVVEVLALDLSAVEPPPPMGTHLDTALIRGMIERDGEFLIVLDADRVFSTDDLGGAHAAEHEADAVTA